MDHVSFGAVRKTMSNLGLKVECYVFTKVMVRVIMRETRVQYIEMYIGL